MDNTNTYGMDYTYYTQHVLKKPQKEFISSGNYYHYTSLENCLKMLEHKGGYFEMWASHISFLNDKEEHINGLKMIERKVDDLLVSKGDNLSDWIEDYEEKRIKQIKLTSDIFVICFCNERNLLSQWKYYGKNSGIAIQYDLKNCEYSGYIQGIENVKYKNQRFINNFPHKVIYDNLQKQAIVDEFIKEHIYNIYDSVKDDIEKKRTIERNMDMLYSFAPLFKHDSFKEESESRLLFRPLYMLPAKNASDMVYYRASEGRIIPYMKIRIKGRVENGKRKPVIKSLTVGPGQNQDLIFEALKHFVQNKFSGDENHFQLESRRDYSYIKVNGIEIRKSSMPFRG